MGVVVVGTEVVTGGTVVVGTEVVGAGAGTVVVTPDCVWRALPVPQSFMP